MLSLAIWSGCGAILGWLTGTRETLYVPRDTVRRVAAGSLGGAFGGFISQWNLTPIAPTVSSITMASIGAVAFSAISNWLAQGPGSRTVSR